MAKDVRCLSNCQNGKVCNAIGGLLQSKAQELVKNTTELFLTIPSDPVENIINLVYSTWTCDKNPLERIECSIQKEVIISLPCSEAKKNQFEESLSTLFNTNVECSVVPVSDSDLLFSSDIGICTSSVQNCPTELELNSTLELLEFVLETLTFCMNPFNDPSGNPVDKPFYWLFGFIESIKTLSKTVTCEDLDSSTILIPASNTQFVCDFLTITATNRHIFTANMICPQQINEIPLYDPRKKIVVLNCQDKSIVLSGCYFYLILLSDCNTDLPADSNCAKIEISCTDISSIIIDCKIQNATVVYVLDDEEIKIKSFLCFTVDMELQSYFIAFLNLIIKQLDQGYIEPFIENGINLFLDSCLEIFYFVCISFDILLGSYLGAFGGVFLLILSPLISIVSSAVFLLPALVPQAALVLPYLKFSLEFLSSIPRPDESFQIPLLNTFIKEIEDNLDSTSWLYLESCFSKLLIANETSCFDPSTANIEDVPELITDLISSINIFESIFISDLGNSSLKQIVDHPVSFVGEDVSYAFSIWISSVLGSPACNGPNVSTIACLLSSSSSQLFRQLNRLSGASSGYYKSISSIQNTLNQYPWQCSLKTRVNKMHRCGVTLLSAPPKRTILVSSAHCNFICKDSDGFVVDTCCCRRETEPSTCRTFNSFCGTDASLQEALPSDLLIVCGEWDIGSVSERLSIEDEVVLRVINYTNHPLFSIKKGVIGGADISVYFVDEEPLKKEGIVKKGKLYPACLPTKAHKNGRGIISSWSDPLDIGIFYKENNPEGRGSVKENIDEYREKQLILKHVELEAKKCEDPEWMNSDTYYPKGTICGFDPSRGSCFDTGDSGSGFLKERFQGGFSWEGPLSFYRGCQSEFINFGKIVQTASAFHVGKNPGVFTEGSCYLEWIAEQYKLVLAKGYNTNCTKATGDVTDANKEECKADNGQMCQFNTGLVVNTTASGFLVGTNITGIALDKCLLGAQSHSLVQMNYWCLTLPNNKECYDDLGVDFNFLVAGSNQTAITAALKQCNGTYKDLVSPCANNCRGVNASDIVVGGAAVFASAIAATSILSLSPIAMAALGIGTLSMGGMIVSRATCAGPLYCISGQGTCCLLVVGNRGLVCPSRC